MFRLRLETSLLTSTALLWSVWASAQQPAPDPATVDDEDLEVPASAVRPETAPAAVPGPGPAPTAQAKAVPARRATRSDARALQPSPERDEPIHLESRAHARLVPTGLTISGYLQAQYQRSAVSEDQLQQGGTPLNQNEFVVRRARLRVDRGWEYAAATLELDAHTAGGPNVGVRRAEGLLFYRASQPADRPPLIVLSAGLLDLPFGYELLESARVRWFMERSLGSRALFPTEMDAGVKLSGAAAFLRYAVAVSNGEPVDEHGFPHDPNNNKEVTGRFGAEGALGNRLELSGGTSFAVGKGFHSGQDATKSAVVWRDLNEDGAHQSNEFFGVPGSAATPSENFKRWAIGLDLGVTLRTPLGSSRLYGEAFVASNYDRGFAPSDPVLTSLDARQAGGYVALTQELTRYGVAGFRASIYDPNSDLIEVRADRTLPKTQIVKTFSPLLGFVLPERARLLLQYDFVRDYLARDAVGVPTDADNDQLTLRLQVEL